MKVSLKPGKYIVAVSGGMDSVALLDLLSRQKNLRLVVAHFDHGMRPESADDAKFVSQLAKKFVLPFELGHGRLGYGASEAVARLARYDFLKQVQARHEADKIVTAHHQDDLIETAIINLLRGTGPRGLSAISINPSVARPLLNYSKADIKEYITARNLKWREDSTNIDTDFLRNNIRANLLTKISASERNLFLSHINQIVTAEAAMRNLVEALNAQLFINDSELVRAKYIDLPSDVGRALLHNYLSSHRLDEIDWRLIDRTDIAIRTGRAGQRVNLKQGGWLRLTATKASFDIPGKQR